LIQPILVAARSKAWVCVRWIAGIAGSNTIGGMDIYLLWVQCVSVRGLCDGPIRRPEESYRQCVCYCDHFQQNPSSHTKRSGIRGSEWEGRKYSRTPLLRKYWDGEPSGHAKNPDNWIFLWKWATLAVWSGNRFLQTALSGYIFIYVQI